MFSLQIVDIPDFHYTQNVLDEIALTVSKHISIPQNGVLNIVFMDGESIQNLNKKYRNIDSPTDVLSFHYFDDFSHL